MNLPDKTCEEEIMIMSMDTEEKEKETTRLDQLSASIVESADMEEYSGGLRERSRVPPGGAGGGHWMSYHRVGGTWFLNNDSNFIIRSTYHPFNSPNLTETVNLCVFSCN